MLETAALAIVVEVDLLFHLQAPLREQWKLPNLSGLVHAHSAFWTWISSALPYPLRAAVQSWAASCSGHVADESRCEDSEKPKIEQERCQQAMLVRRAHDK